MFGTHDLALFALAVLVINATPGVDMAFTLVSTLRGGVKAGLAAAAALFAAVYMAAGTEVRRTVSSSRTRPSATRWPQPCCCWCVWSAACT